MAFKVSNYPGSSGLISPDHLPVLFRVQPFGQGAGIDQVTEHDGELTTLGFRVRSNRYRRRLLALIIGSSRRRLDHRRNRFHQLLAGAKRDIEILEILFGQIRQNLDIDFIFGEHRRIFCKSDARKPLVDLCCQGNSPDEQV